MVDRLDLKAFQYGLNKDEISTKIEESLNIVLVRHFLNFCVNVNAMLASLKNILNREALLYVTFAMPTLGTCMRWQLESRIYCTLHNPEIVIKNFAEQGFKEVSKYYSTDSYYLDDNKLCSPLLFTYRLLNGFKKNINVSLRVRSAVIVFRLV